MINDPVRVSLKISNSSRSTLICSFDYWSS